jgi:hypothetical protein
LTNNPNLKNTHSSTQPKRKKKKKKKNNTSLDDAGKSAPSDAHPGMEVEEAAVRTPDVRICLGVFISKVGLTGQPWSANKTAINSG